MPLMGDAYDYADAQLLRQKIAAMWVGFTVDTDSDGPDVTDVAAGTDVATNLQPGIMEHLPPGRDVRWSDPPGTEGYGEYMKAVQRMIASAMDITYEELSGDLEGVNFSSARIGRMAMQRAVSAVQWTVLMPVLCEPMGDWLKEGLKQATGEKGEFRIRWTPPRFGLTDASREVPAILQSIAGGLTSRQRAIREMGYDPEEIEAEIAADKAAAERIGVTFEGAPAAPVEAPDPADFDPTD
jgi:lambda family phage portal protein